MLMNNLEPDQILITGATGSIGSALAHAYSAPGVRLHLHGRNPDKLFVVASSCRRLGATVFTHFMELRDIAGVRCWLEDLGEVDLVIVNAGMNTDIGETGKGEPWAEVEALLDTNLKASMAIVHALLPSMRRRGGGQIALVSSLAGYFGLPVTPAYCASKAGLKAYGEALRGWLGPEGIRVNVIMPGYVKSPMCDGMPGPKPFLWSPERAAQTIKHGLARDKARISFPFPLNWGTWWLAVLPASVSVRIVRWLGYGS